MNERRSIAGTIGTYRAGRDAGGWICDPCLPRRVIEFTHDGHPRRAFAAVLLHRLLRHGSPLTLPATGRRARVTVTEERQVVLRLVGTFTWEAQS